MEKIYFIFWLYFRRYALHYTTDEVLHRHKYLDANFFFVFFFVFTTSLTWFRSQFWYQLVPAASRSQLWGSNRDPPYQIQHQSPLNQLMIGRLFFLLHQLIQLYFFSFNYFYILWICIKKKLFKFVPLFIYTAPLPPSLSFFILY
jgi:hypothetical protein